jgi:hypothetical protein
LVSTRCHASDLGRWCRRVIPERRHACRSHQRLLAPEDLTACFGRLDRARGTHPTATECCFASRTSASLCRLGCLLVVQDFAEEQWTCVWSGKTSTPRRARTCNLRFRRSSLSSTVACPRVYRSPVSRPPTRILIVSVPAHRRAFESGKNGPALAEVGSFSVSSARIFVQGLG